MMDRLVFVLSLGLIATGLETGLAMLAMGAARLYPLVFRRDSRSSGHGF